MMMREPDFVDECYADKDLSLLKNLTLVIPTYNRNYYLSRCLWYHAHFPFGEIIVADSSPEEKKVVNRETVEKVREMFGANVRYLEYEPETEKYGGDIYRKWGDAVQHVETEYVQFCPDKEFILPETFCNNINFLDTHHDYISVIGKDYAVISGDDLLSNYVVKRRYVHKINVDSTYATERFNLAISSPGFANSLLLDIGRTNLVKRIYLHYENQETTDLRYGEIYLAYAGYIAGKVMANNDRLTRVRDEISVNNIQIYSPYESSTLRYPKCNEYIHNGDADIYYNSICSSFTNMFKEFTNATDTDVLNCLLSKRRELYYVFSHPNTLIGTILYYVPLIHAIWKKFPLFIQDNVRYTLLKNKNEDTNTPINYQDLEPESQVIIQIISRTYYLNELDKPVYVISIA